MHVAILAWNLTDHPIVFDELRHWVATKAAADYANLPGVRLKTWFSNERKRIWGAVYVVDSPDAIHPDRLPRLADGKTGPVGTPPDTVAWFNLEALVFGPGDLEDLSQAGLSMPPTDTTARAVV
jgi:hypothetical protein